MDKFMLPNKVAVITGAASGIGRATAQLFAREGARVVVSDITDEAGQAVVAGIRADGGEALYVHADVGHMPDCEQLIQTAQAHYGRIDILHSNTGTHRRGTAVEITEADWDWSLNICLKSAWMLAHHALPGMLAQGGGVILLTGSVHALWGYAGYAAYEAAKGGLLALTHSLAVDFAPTIRVNTILPGAVVSGQWTGVGAAEMHKVADCCALKRNAQPEEIAQVALFLASPMSSFMTGASVVVDGGLRASAPTPRGL
ncbi:MAG: SDR family oxidoreductase [Anaerolineales bacterium]|nr:SDR family oxidoreductase [Anaerolineales bacterium]